MIRTLAPDELEWFLAASFTFLGHSDARGFARRAVPLLRDREDEASRAHVLFRDGGPVAGAYVLAPESENDDQNLHIVNAWFAGDPADLQALLRGVLERYPHEAAHAPLVNAPPERRAELVAAFEEFGFAPEVARELEFRLADLPPLGAPLVLEAWTYESDGAFKNVYADAEGHRPTEFGWAYLKRFRGPFSPDLWFIARETLDQDAVGYAFFGAHADGIDGSYYLTAAGVMPQYRDSSEMLRRLVLTGMHELAARSPLGSIRTQLLERDPKLIRIFEMMGFASVERVDVLMKWPR